MEKSIKDLIKEQLANLKPKEDELTYELKSYELKSYAEDRIKQHKEEALRKYPLTPDECLGRAFNNDEDFAVCTGNTYYLDGNKAFRQKDGGEVEDITDKAKVFHLVIQPFSEYIIISNKMAVKPYKDGYKTPKLTKVLLKQIEDKVAVWSDKGYLTDLQGNVIPSNGNKAGKPRMWRVSGQGIYNGSIKDLARKNYIDKLHDYLDPWFAHLPSVEEKDMTLVLEFFIEKQHKNLDNDARHIWGKVIQDIMKVRILKEDTVENISGNFHRTRYVQDEKDVRLEISLYINY